MAGGPRRPDGDGYVEYRADGARLAREPGVEGLPRRDSFADGRLAEPPIAMAEVQAYTYAAWRAGAALAAAEGRRGDVTGPRRGPTTCGSDSTQDFWLEERGAFAIALDGKRRPVDAVTSNMGHCLWAGIVEDPDEAAAVGSWLVSTELFSGWGVRTLATSMARYSPLSYHNGSVWPHDTAIAIAGPAPPGSSRRRTRIARACCGGGRAGRAAPELFAGLTVEEMPVPVRYPTSCSPQAWASAAPLLVVRALLGLEPDVPEGRIEVDPTLPEGATTLNLAELPLAGARVTIEIDRDAVAVRGLPPGLALIRRA